MHSFVAGKVKNVLIDNSIDIAETIASINPFYNVEEVAKAYHSQVITSKYLPLLAKISMRVSRFMGGYVL